MGSTRIHRRGGSPGDQEGRGTPGGQRKPPAFLWGHCGVESCLRFGHIATRSRRSLAHSPRPRRPYMVGNAACAPRRHAGQCGGHFPGSACVHWADGAAGMGALLTGDTIFVTPGEDRVTFVWSAPNRLPLSERAVRGVVEAVRPYSFERIYGGWWEPVLRHDAKRVLEVSAERYIHFLRGGPPVS